MTDSQTPTRDPRFVEGAAEARLIAARIDILAALKECASRCRYDGDLWHDHGDEVRASASWEAADMAQAVLTRVAVCPHGIASNLTCEECERTYTIDYGDPMP